MGVRSSGPYIIERVHVNGTLAIELCPGVTKCINIRRVIPKSELWTILIKRVLVQIHGNRDLPWRRRVS
eukprot:13298331-Ditylum_brightwellii.AAC.1